ncbi:hypothetical protein BGZ99_000302 [Dissophora globulifera]|uniref:Uncharacterized protein n=1 Tax=Dissophora globulifera TaxID=979702 RepID=A0A9P6R141_9FUNG|nr:hypothetical protein BGZ99_000302 [Dissophora globulifera]
MYRPVIAFQEYYCRIAHALILMPHYRDPAQLFIPLVRNLHNPKLAVSVNLINSRIKHYLELTPRPFGALRLKVRAIRAARALIKGMSFEDVMTHGN